jgi:adenylate cyclase
VNAAQRHPARWHRRLRSGLRRGTVAGVVAGTLAVALSGSEALADLEARSYDLRSRWTADASRAHPDIVVVAIDENSLDVYRDRLGRWPWSRDVHATLIEYLHAAGARLVVFDILFPEPDLRDPEADRNFAEVIAASGRVVLPMTFTPGDAVEASRWSERRGRREDDALRRLALGSDGGSEARRAYAEPPWTFFLAGAVAVGDASIDPGEDGVLRHYGPAIGYGGDLYPSLALAAARAAEPERFGGPVSVEDRALAVGTVTLPADRGRLVLRWRGPYQGKGGSTYPVFPAFHVLNSVEQVLAGDTPDVPFERFEGKIVLVGVTGAGLQDARSTPLRPLEPGVHLHATALDNLLSGDPIRAASPLQGGALVLFSGLAVGLAAAIPSSVALAAAASLLLLLILAGLTGTALAAGLWLPLAAPVLAGVVAYAGATATGYMVEGRERRRVREIFGRYLAPEVVRRLAEDPAALRLGGDRVQVTVLFTDVRGFTALVERLPAEVTIELLNDYLEAMAEIVFRHGGTLDKFIGDAVMAFWGAPLPDAHHAGRALAAAMEMQQAAERIDRAWAGRGLGQPFAIGVGVSTGEAVVGNVGSLSRKLDYTAIGDTVNLASRLEGLTRQHGAPILVSEATAAAAGLDFEFSDLGEVHVKGKERGVRILGVRAARREAGGVRSAVALGAGLLLLAGAAGALQAQEPERLKWSAWYYQPSAPGQDVRSESLTLVARVELYSKHPLWRAEIQRPGQEDAVLVEGGSGVRVLTRLGATPLARHALADDALARLLVAELASAPVRPRTGRSAVRGTGGEIAWIVARRPTANPQVPDQLFSTSGTGMLGRRLVRLGVDAAGGERTTAVATAAARGVARVRTAGGEITIQPDSAAVARLDRIEIRLEELDRFLREAALGPHADGREEER